MILVKEAKQVGTLYHFTSLEALDKIIDNEGLVSNIHDWISFTRNFTNPKTGHLEELNVRLAFDGDKLSNKFKIEPYLDKGYATRSDEEQEERVLNPSRKILKCFFALKRIDILKGTDVDESYWSKIKLPIFFVNSFKKV